MKTIGIAGGTGFVGSRLATMLAARGCEVVVFTRSPSLVTQDNISYSAWNPARRIGEAAAFRRLDAVVNLAGAGIADHRWTAARKKEIVESRVQAADFLHAQLNSYAEKCGVYVAASAIGYYGADIAGHVFTETDLAADDFLGDTCARWEVASKAAGEGRRTVILRIGIVMGGEAGAFPRLTAALRFGIMPILGTGRQVMSWIEADDMARMIVYALEQPGLAGIYNAVAPEPATFAEVMRAAARARGGLHIPMPAPAAALKMALGELSAELLKSCTVSARKIMDAGFRFQHHTIGDAMRKLMQRKA